mmetsp:Transcript_29316/g.90703  ORF Transcript_29316/g.90703 Transcript_29316/m.90703 type:complete len:123 (+) Transcript_29316:95-463(+)
MIWYSLNVLWSALLGYALLDDVLPRRTVAACAFAVGCVVVVFAPQLGAGGDGVAFDAVGDFCAIYVGVGIRAVTKLRGAFKVQFFCAQRGPGVSLNLLSKFWQNSGISRPSGWSPRRRREQP